MKTPQDKAKELYEKFIHQICEDNGLYFNDSTDKSAKQCAIIACDEIILEQCKSSELKNAKYQAERIDYWQSVKNEISNL